MIDEKRLKRTVDEVLDHHIRVLAAGFVDEVVYDYADGATIITSDGVVHGLDEIRKFFTNSVANVLPPSSISTFHKKITCGEVAFIVWSAESPFYSIPFGTDTFVIRDGQIVEQTFAGILNRKGA
jgi:hypothetical protein